MWFLASLWVGLALIATLLAIWVKIAAPTMFVLLFLAKMVSRMFRLFPAVRSYGYPGREGWYYTTQAQYSYLVATVIGSAIVPAMIANAFFMPSHLLSESGTPLAEVPEALAHGAT